MTQRKIARPQPKRKLRLMNDPELQATYGGAKNPNWKPNAYVKIVTEGQNEVSQLLNTRIELTGSNREKLLSTIQDSRLAKLANELYRPGATVGDGGTADKLISEFSESSTRHLQKAKERLIGLNKLIDSKELSLNDLDIAEALRIELVEAIKLFG